MLMLYCLPLDDMCLKALMRDTLIESLPSSATGRVIFKGKPEAASLSGTKIRSSSDVLLAEHQKLGPFMQVLPKCSRFLDQALNLLCLSDSFPYKEIENGKLWEVEGKVSTVPHMKIESDLQGFEHVYGDIVSGLTDVKKLGFLVKDMDGKISLGIGIFIFSSKSDFIVLTSTHINVVISWNRLTMVSSLLGLDCLMVAYSILTSLGSCIARVFGLAGFWFHWSLQCISIASPLHGCPLDFFKSTRGFFLMVTQAPSSNLGRAEFRYFFQVTSLWVSVIVCIKHRRSFAWSSCSAAASHMLGELDGIHTTSPGVVDLFASKDFDYLPQQASSKDLPLNLLSVSSLSLVVCMTVQFIGLDMTLSYSYVFIM